MAQVLYEVVPNTSCMAFKQSPRNFIYQESKTKSLNAVGQAWDAAE